MSDVNVKLGVAIKYDTAKDDKILDVIGIINPVLEQVKKDPTIRQVIREALTLSPAQIEQLSVGQLNRYILVMPQAIIWYQDCFSRALNKLHEAEDEFDDVIGTPAALLTKEAFEKGSQPPTKEMKLAKMRELFPEEYARIIGLVRERKIIVTRLDGQIKSLQIASDNLKKVRDSYRSTGD